MTGITKGPLSTEAQAPGDHTAPDLARIKQHLLEIQRQCTNFNIRCIVSVVHSDPRWHFRRGKRKMLSVDTAKALMKGPFHWSRDTFGFRQKGERTTGRAWFRLLTEDKARVLQAILDDNWPMPVQRWRVGKKSLPSTIASKQVTPILQVTSPAPAPAQPAQQPQTQQSRVRHSLPIADRMLNIQRARSWERQCRAVRTGMLDGAGVSLQTHVDNGWIALAKLFDQELQIAPYGDRRRWPLNRAGVESNDWRKDAQALIWFLCLITGPRHYRTDPMVAFHKFFPDATYRQFGDVVNGRDHRWKENRFAVHRTMAYAAKLDYKNDELCIVDDEFRQRLLDNDYAIDRISDLLGIDRGLVRKYVWTVAPGVSYQHPWEDGYVPRRSDLKPAQEPAKPVTVTVVADTVTVRQQIARVRAELDALEKLIG